MRILIVTIEYPSPENFANSRFIHERVIEYAKFEDVQVLVACINNKLKKTYEYIHEGIEVKGIRTDNIKSLVDQYKPEVICIHFFEGKLINALIPYINIPIVVWVHGVEALGWYRRYFDFNLSRSFFRYIVRNTVQLWRFRKLIKISNKKEYISFVFVSRWMLKTTEFDTMMKIRNFHIISNPIDTELFKYHKKDKDMRKNILIIRSFESKKYANDIAIKAILHLSSNPIFKELNFEIYGDRDYFDKLTEPLKKFPNVKLHKKFIEHHLIPEIHRKHGIFLCPTRQDSQGVSMCEAMASGLVPITSHNTAIPEFVQDDYSGFLTKSYYEIAERLIELYENENKFLMMSANASASIKNSCAKNLIIDKEITLIKNSISAK